MPHQRLDVAVVGLGPAGMGAIHRISDQKLDLEISCFDLGPRPKEKDCAVLDDAGCIRRSDCHILSGFGGSSLLSGGKLSTLPAGDSLVEITGDEEAVSRTMTEALEYFNDYLTIANPTVSPEDIKTQRLRFRDNGFDLDYYDAHVMTGSEEEVRQAYCEMLSDFERSGPDFNFNTKVNQIEDADNGLILHTINNEGIEEEYLCKNVLIGVGLSGDDLLKRLKTEFGIQTTLSKLELGVRLEFPVDAFPEIDQGHKDLKLHRGNCRTFCVCKGGQLAPYFHDGMSLMDGHVDRTNRTEYTNLGIRLRLPPARKNERIYSSIRENYIEATKGVPIRQSYDSYIEQSEPNIPEPDKSSIRYWRLGEVDELFPEKQAEELRHTVKSFVEEAIPEERQSEVDIIAPGLYYPGLEFNLGTDFEVSDGLHIIGEGTGQFRGILQAFSSGLLCAEAVSGEVQG